jgi:hypothetical protein
VVEVVGLGAELGGEGGELLGGEVEEPVVVDELGLTTGWREAGSSL